MASSATITGGRTLTAGAIAGLAGIAAWMVVESIDEIVARNDYDDVKLLGAAFVRGAAWKPLGAALHAVNGVLFGLAYAAVAEPRLPGPAWLRGLLAAQIESTTLSTLTPLIDRFHPAVLDGRMAPTATRVSLAQAVFRHAVFGVVLGCAYEMVRHAGGSRWPRRTTAPHRERQGEATHPR